MYIENFDTWFESKKVITGKSEEMNNLKDIFFDCYDNFFNLKNDELEDRINELEQNNSILEYENDELEDNLKEIVNFIKKSESLDELKGKMKKYGYIED